MYINFQGCAQVSLADFNIGSISQKWYNILGFHIMNSEDKIQPSSQKPISEMTVKEKQETDVTGFKQQASKEESSDDSTIISSQTSTLTRNQDWESLRVDVDLNFKELVNCLQTTEEFDSEDSDDDDDCDEEGITVEFRPPERLEVVLETEDYDQDCLEDKYTDKQTNTECVFYPDHAKQMKLLGNNCGATYFDDRGVIKRSQTFSPSPAVSKNHYICKLNRSDSDSAMPLYRKGGDPFQRNAIERRSLRFRRQSGSMAALSPSKSHSHLPVTPRTSLDLELDLQAQHTRLDMLNSELSRLRELKQRLEVAKEQGDTELASWVLEDQQFQNLVAQVENNKIVKTIEEKKIEKMLRKVSREIYKLRKTKAGNGKPDLISFR